jgi:hypothetical protein
MFALSSTEAVYKFFGIKAQEQLINLITHHWVFMAMITLLLVWLLFKTAWSLSTSGQTNGALFGNGPLVKVALGFALSISLMSSFQCSRVLTINNFAGQTWNEHPKAREKMSDTTPKVMTLFALLAGSAEQLSKLASQTFSAIFDGGSANLLSPHWIFKALIYASTTHIEDQSLLDKIDSYIEGCLGPILGQIHPFDLWLRDEESRNSWLWQKFKEEKPFEGSSTCLELRGELDRHIASWSGGLNETQNIYRQAPHGITAVIPEAKDYDWLANLNASHGLLNYIKAKEKSSFTHLENPAGANFGDGVGVWRAISKFFSIEAWERFLFGPEQAGSLSANQRAEELSRILKIAPEIKGRILFYLIASFPLWVFASACLQRIGPIVFWTITYFSITMWAPLWSLSYNILISQFRAGETLTAISEIKDAISMTSVTLLNERSKWMIQAYCFSQFGIAAVVTSFAVWMGKGWLVGEREGVPGAVLLRKII